MYPCLVSFFLSIYLFYNVTVFLFAYNVFNKNKNRNAYPNFRHNNYKGGLHHVSSGFVILYYGQKRCLEHI